MGLQMQCESLTAAQKVRAAELFQKVSKLGVDASNVPGLIPNGVALAGVLDVGGTPRSLSPGSDPTTCS